MINGILGIKLGQSQSFTDDGRRIPVTFIKAGPCWVTKVTNAPTYKSFQLSFGTSKNISKAQIGNMKKAGLDLKPRFLREIRVQPAEDNADTAIGTEVKAEDVFKLGDNVIVSGTSKGKGFAGVVKRHGFSGGPRTHGQSDRERAPGSIGQTTTPGRVYKGKRMAGRMGGKQITATGLRVVAINSSTHVITIKGLVPGAIKSLLLIQKEG